MITIHQRAEQLVRESRWQMTKAQAYSELSRRGQVSKAAKKRLCTVQPNPSAFSNVERPDLMPFDPSN